MKVDYVETVQCGTDLQVLADVWNVGEDDQDEVSVRIKNKELDLDEIIEIGDIDAFENENLDTILRIPNDAVEKFYTLIFTVLDEDHDIYENDYDEDESEFTLPLKVDGSCGTTSAGNGNVGGAAVFANLESESKAGEELVIKITVTNLGDDLTSYTLNAARYADWASSVNLDKTTLLLSSGSSENILFTFNVNEDASGEKEFDVEVLSGNELIVKQPVSVLIEESASTGFLSGLTGNVVKGNAYLWGIGILNIVLVIIIVIVAIRISRKSPKAA